MTQLSGPMPGATIRLSELAADASMIAELAATDLAAGRAVAARDAAPEYVRDQVALTTEQRTRARTERREEGPGS